MRVIRVGYAALKGTRHLARDAIALTVDGVVGDRALCLIESATGRVLRSVENPTLAAVRATLDADQLELTLPDGTLVAGELVPKCEPQTVDYWGRPAQVWPLVGRHAGVVSSYLGKSVTLARTTPREVIYYDGVTIITTGELSRLANRLGISRDSLGPRFRASVTLDAEDDPEPGRRLRLGEAEVEVVRPIARCAVIDRSPVTGDRPGDSVLAALDLVEGLPSFGVGARVIRPGVIRLGADAQPLDR